MANEIIENKIVITVGREYGSGGHEIAKRLAKKLDIPFYDKEIAQLVAEKGDLAEKYLLDNEEKAPSYWDFALPNQTVVTTYYYQSMSQTIYLEQTEMIKELAKKGACVIVGRCSDFLLRTIGSINVFVYASLDKRIERKIKLSKENDNVSYEAKEMRKMINSIDKKRKKYYKYYTSQTWGDKTNYDICINTDKLSIDGAVDAIISYVKHAVADKGKV
ncbi:MAG: cytidylate kinase-like family protein [Clostridia bacterium]